MLSWTRLGGGFGADCEAGDVTSAGSFDPPTLLCHVSSWLVWGNARGLGVGVWGLGAANDAFWAELREVFPVGGVDGVVLGCGCAGGRTWLAVADDRRDIVREILCASSSGAKRDDPVGVGACSLSCPVSLATMYAIGRMASGLFPVEVHADLKLPQRVPCSTLQTQLLMLYGWLPLLVRHN